MLSCLLAFIPFAASAVSKQEADSAYMREDYQQAASLYEKLLQQGVSASIYYNLGNAYYRMENMPKAILNYERALVLSPGDKDIRFNLQMARSKTVDRITPESEMFFVTWYRSVVSQASADGWAVTAVVALVVAIALALLYLFAGRIWLRKVGFFGSLLLMVLFIAANVFAWQQKQRVVSRSGAIIMSSAATVKSTPSKGGTDLFILHEGTKVTIIDNSMSGWAEVSVADGREGWIEKSAISVI